MLTYEGKGYSPAFIANFDILVSRLNKGEEIELMRGPDAICAPLLAEDPCAHCLNDSVAARDAVAMAQLAEQNLLPDRQSFHLDGERVAKMRQAFADGIIRQACKGCEWYGLCSEIAKNGYTAVRLRPDMLQ